MSRVSWLRRCVLAATVIAMLPIQVVLAADLPTTTTLDPVPASAFVGDQLAVVAHVTDGATGTVRFETSTDDSTWNAVTTAELVGTVAQTSWVIDSFSPLGTVFVRAHYLGLAGFEESVSTSRSYQVVKHQTTVGALQLSNPVDAGIAPGTALVRLQAAVNHGDPIFEELTESGWQTLTGLRVCCTHLDFGPISGGMHTYRARVDGDAYWTEASSELTVDIQPTATEPYWSGSLTAAAHHSLVIQVGVNGDNASVPFTGHLSVKDVATNTVIGSSDTWFADVTIPAMATGAHDFLVTYAGDGAHAASSKTFRVTVAAEQVDATGVGLDTTTFYPIVDGYRDTVHAKGNRLEPASVSTSIYTASGTRVRVLTAPRAAGAYSLAWNGKSTSGVLQAAGKYRIVQTLTDAFGTRKSVTSYVTLSRKRLYTYSKTLTLAGPTKKTSSWAGFQFTLPSATVYKTIKFAVYGKTTISPGIGIGGWDSRRCTFSNWSPSCVASWTRIGTSVAWWSKALSPTYNRSGRSVRAFAQAFGAGAISKGRLTVTYGLLR